MRRTHRAVIAALLLVAVTCCALGMAWAIDPNPSTGTVTCPDAVICPLGHRHVSGTVSVRLQSQDADGIRAVALWLVNSKGIESQLGSRGYSTPYPTSSDETFSWNTTTRPAGGYRLVDRVTDRYGNHRDCATLQVLIDRAPPTCQIISPTAGQTVSGTITITATANDENSIGKVKFYVDGSLIGTDTTGSSGQYSVSWNTTTVANGSHQLKATAYDCAGNTTDSTTVSVTVNNPKDYVTAPAITVSISGGDDQVLPGQQITFTANASDMDNWTRGSEHGSDADSITSYSWTCTAGSFIGSTTQPSVTWQAPSSGQCTISCTVNDRGIVDPPATGNRNDSPATGSKTVDVEAKVYVPDPPIGVSVSGGDGTIFPGQEVTFTASASDTDNWTQGTQSGSDADTIISYSWSCSAGSFAGSTTESSATWVAPDGGGSCTVSCTVNDRGIVDPPATGNRDDSPARGDANVEVLSAQNPSDTGGPAPCWGGGNPGASGGGAGCGGKPMDRINTWSGTLTIDDMPVYYRDVAGGTPFSISYNTTTDGAGTLGPRWSHSYDTRVVPTSDGAWVVRGNGWRHWFRLSGGAYEHPYGVFQSLAVEGSGWVLTQLGREKLHFDASGRLSSVEDSDGLSSQLGYDATSGLLTSITDPMGRATTLEYFADGLLQRVTVPGGLHADFAYDTNSPKRLQTVTDAVGDPYTFGYDSENNITSITEPSTRRVEYTYTTVDGQPAVASVQVADAPTTRVEYHYTDSPPYRYVDIVDQKDGGRTTRQVFHAIEDLTDPDDAWRRGALAQVIDDYGAGRLNLTQTRTFDSEFRLLTVQDSSEPESGGKPHVHHYCYRDANNPTEVTKYIDPENYDPALGESSPGYVFEYDNGAAPYLGNLTWSTTPEGRITEYAYEPNTQRLSAVTVHDDGVNGNLVTSFSYWGSDYAYQVHQVTDARGNVTALDYYPDTGYLHTVTPPAGSGFNPVSLVWNGQGDVTSLTDGNGNTTTYQYDGIHRTTDIFFPDIGGGVTNQHFVWSCCGRLASATDGNGVVTKYDSDPKTRMLVTVTQDYGGALAYATNYTYDEVGNVKTVRNARGKVTTYWYDGADRTTQIDYPDGTSESWSYHDDGRVATYMDGRGFTTAYHHDADDRIGGPAAWDIDYPTTADVDVVRDRDGLITAATQNTSLTPLTTQADYYLSGLLRSLTDGYDKTVSYEYNQVGATSKVTAPDGRVYNYFYNALNQLSLITSPQFGDWNVSFAYDAGGRLTRIDRPGSYTSYQYNERNWITAVMNRKAVTEAVLYDAQYYYDDGLGNWDDTGNPLLQTEDFGSGLHTTSFGYDRVYRLTSEVRVDPLGATEYDASYGYDEVGNRTSQLIDGVATAFGYDDNDKLLYLNDILSASYDGNGNITSTFGPAGDAAFTYDDENQLTSITYLLGTENVTDLYQYDPSGRRLSARLDGTYYRYIYNGERVLQGTDDAGATVTNFVTAGGSYFSPLLAIQPTGGAHQFPLYDLTGTTHALADPDGTVTDQYVMDAFGVSLSSPGATLNPYRFGGAWGYMTDPSGALQLGVRTYLPKLGRFLQQDPSGDGMNWYGYAGSNPVTRIDPSGEIAPLIAVVAVGYFLYNAADVVAVGYDAYAAASDPSAANVAALGADVVLAASPAPAGAGATVRAGKRGCGVLKRLNSARRKLNPFKQEVMHLLPLSQKLRKEFASRGIKNLDAFTIQLPAGRHRLRRFKGVHTNATDLGTNWNREWQRFFDRNPGAKKRDVYCQLKKMRRDFGIE